MKSTKSLFRERERAISLAKAGKQCDACRKYSTNLEYHEALARKRTMHSQKLRETSYSRYVCGVLCHECHQELHMRSPRANYLRASMWQSIKARWGKERVMQYVQDHLPELIDEIGD